MSKTFHLYSRTHFRMLRRIISEGKKAGCTDCGKQGEMTYDHLPERGSKEFDIGSVGVSTWASTESLKAEIAKCEVVCPTCHRRREEIRLVAATELAKGFRVLAALAGEVTYAYPYINKVFRLLRILSGGVTDPSWN